MSQLKIFNHERFGQLEILIVNSKEHFPATDVAKKLGYADPYSAIRQHTRKDGWVKHPVTDSLGRRQDKRFITEGNLYRLITNSKLPEAEIFETWVFDEVLPSIRKHGAYMTPETIEQALLNPDTIIQLATNLKSEQEERRRLEEQKKRDEPYTTFGKVVATSDASINIGSFAKLLYDKHGIKMGRNKLFAWLRDNGYLMRSGREKNQPKQQYIQQGLFETTVTMISRTHGDVESVTTMITGKGQVEIAKKIMNDLNISEVI